MLAFNEPKLCRVALYQEFHYAFECFFAGFCCCRQILKDILIVVLDKIDPCFLFLLVQIIDESVSLSVSNLPGILRNTDVQPRSISNTYSQSSSGILRMPIVMLYFPAFHGLYARGVAFATLKSGNGGTFRNVSRGFDLLIQFQYFHAFTRPHQLERRAISIDMITIIIIGMLRS